MSKGSPPNHITHYWDAERAEWVKRDVPQGALDFDRIITEARNGNYRDAGREPTHAEQHQSYLLHIAIGVLVVIACVGLWAAFGN